MTRKMGWQGLNIQRVIDWIELPLHGNSTLRHPPYILGYCAARSRRFLNKAVKTGLRKIIKSRIAEIKVPARPIPIHHTKFVMAHPQPTGMRIPQMPTPLAKSITTVRPKMPSRPMPGVSIMMVFGGVNRRKQERQQARRRSGPVMISSAPQLGQTKGFNERR